MSMKIYDVEKIKNISVPIAQKYGVKKLVLYGDYESSVFTDRYDIYFYIDKGKIKGWEFFGFINDLEDDLGTTVDVLTNDSVQNSIITEYLKDEIVLYEE